MVDQPGAVDEELKKLRKRYLEEQIDEASSLVKLEEPVDKVFTVKLTLSNGKPEDIRFKRMTQEHANFFQRLKLYPKLLKNEELTEKEITQYREFKLFVIAECSIDKHVIRNFISEDNEYIDMVFDKFIVASGLDSDYQTRLNKFVKSELGYNYGSFWIGTMHMLPSQVAKLPATDVQYATAWLNEFMERNREQGK